MGDDQDAPSGSNEGGNRFVHDTVMHQFSHVTGNGHGAGMETVSMTHQPPIVQRNDNERPSISTEYPKDPVLGPDGAVTGNAGNTVQTTNQLLTPDQFFRYSNYQVQDTEVTPLLRLAPPTLQQPPPLPQGPAANGNNGTLWPAGVIVAGPSEQMPLVRPNDMPVAPSERQAADDSAEHQEMRDMLIAQIRQGLQHLRRQSDTIEMLEALRHLGRQSDAILEEYAAGDDIGKLDNCVHVYHVTCITLWLKKKNSCPACKAVALNALE
ncbi:hypothetical protein Dsin_009015 [Dipteronia sinensis]|uniref:RING-type E3 ubiquitin transferase n=1 Tax=Dipteronia sinensis TaxID=43782 RepID=A0AAE0AQG2_9ROSI|nr:hypothetical protein Dsin_009015 [Dipteronia sinensis]